MQEAWNAPKTRLTNLRPLPGKCRSSAADQTPSRPVPNQKADAGLGVSVCRRRERAWDGVETGSANKRTGAVESKELPMRAAWCRAGEARESLWVAVGTVGRVVGAQAGCKGGGEGTQGCVSGPSKHRKHVFHFFETGRVEVQRLIKGCRSLPSRKDRAYETAGEVRAGGEREGGGCDVGQRPRNTWLLISDTHGVAGREVCGAQAV